ncbi:uncharacterized protein LOC128673654 [Plodia interpunctella]|uniref:uncharacterized protein LOC128673654 n=1 Tax=Plodia interpunctella TaxID=58824 RepID=UPI0023683C56|nr:uncharacterized protein LOC128673654 [Plodia interpunctella]
MSVFHDDWNFRFDAQDIDKASNFKSKLLDLHEQILNLLDDEFKLSNIVYNGGSLAQSHDQELKMLMEKNKQLRQEIDCKLEGITRQQSQYEKYKQDQKQLSQEIKETHEAFLTAKKYYKKFLKMYYTIESRDIDKQTIFVQFFTESKKDSENYSMRLLRNTNTGNYELLCMTPNLPNFKEVQRKLKETNDVSEALCSVRQAFILIRANKRY